MRCDPPLQHRLRIASLEEKYGGMELEEARRLRVVEEENARPKRVVADQAVQIQILKEVNAKKMVSPSSRRRAVKWVMEEGVGNAAQACRALGLARSSYYLVGQKLERKIIALSEEHPRYGYRRITALMRRKGKAINAKRVQRIRLQAGLQVKERQKRTRRTGTNYGQKAARRTRQSALELGFALRPDRAWPQSSDPELD
jgi:putative transposase